MNASNFGAAPSALGYLYQSELALLELLRRMRQNPSIELSIELVDDVQFESDGEPDELLQIKHHLNGHGDLTNSSGDVWRTIRVWTERAKHGDDALLSMMTTAQAPAGSAAELLRMDDHRDPPAALAKLEVAAHTSISKDTKVARLAFMALAPEARLQLVERIRILDGTPQLGDLDVGFDQELQVAARGRHRPALIERLRGWWSQAVMHHLLQVAAGNTSSRLTAEEVLHRIAAIQDQLRDDNLPIDFQDLPGPSLDEIRQDQRPFVEQLRLIALNDRRLLLAVRAHNRAFAQRSRWMREELLEYGELEQYEGALMEQWEHAAARECEVEPEASEDDRTTAGTKLLDFVETSITTNIRPRCTAPYVTLGSLHMLADKRRIGWHPDWIDRLQELLGPLEQADDEATAA